MNHHQVIKLAFILAWMGPMMPGLILAYAMTYRGAYSKGRLRGLEEAEKLHVTK